MVIISIPKVLNKDKQTFGLQMDIDRIKQEYWIKSEIKATVGQQALVKKNEVMVQIMKQFVSILVMISVVLKVSLYAPFQNDR